MCVGISLLSGPLYGNALSLIVGHLHVVHTQRVTISKVKWHIQRLQREERGEELREKCSLSHQLQYVGVLEEKKGSLSQLWDRLAFGEA